MPKIIKTSGLHRETVTHFQRAVLEAAVLPESEGAGPIDPVEILAQARADAEAQTRTAYEEGLRLGIADGEQKFRESVGETAQVLRDAASRIEDAHRQFIEEVEPQLVRLATSIASKIIEREASISEDVIKRTVRAALEKMLGEEQVVVRVNPKDLELLRSYRAELLDEFEGLKRIELVADDTIDAGGCIAQTDSLRIDGRLDSQLEKILNALLG
jgi:flagellar assembly protein FliH